MEPRAVVWHLRRGSLDVLSPVHFGPGVAKGVGDSDFADGIYLSVTVVLLAADELLKQQRTGFAPEGLNLAHRSVAVEDADPGVAETLVRLEHEPVEPPGSHDLKCLRRSGDDLGEVQPQPWIRGTQVGLQRFLVTEPLQHVRRIPGEPESGGDAADVGHGRFVVRHHGTDLVVCGQVLDEGGHPGIGDTVRRRHLCRILKHRVGAVVASQIRFVGVVADRPPPELPMHRPHQSDRVRVVRVLDQVLPVRPAPVPERGHG